MSWYVAYNRIIACWTLKLLLAKCQNGETTLSISSTLYFKQAMDFEEEAVCEGSSKST